MSKLSLNALKQRVGAIASEELLATISGGTQDACHDSAGSSNDDIRKEAEVVKDNIPT